jgi:hypothetical protein
MSESKLHKLETPTPVTNGGEGRPVSSSRVSALVQGEVGTPKRTAPLPPFAFSYPENWKLLGNCIASFGSN